MSQSTVIAQNIFVEQMSVATPMKVILETFSEKFQNALKILEIIMSVVLVQLLIPWKV